MVTPAGDEPNPADPPEPESTGTGEELLEQWQERLGGGEDPMEALASLLSGRATRRAALFSRVGYEVLGYRLERILGAGGAGVTYAARAADGRHAAVKLVVLAGGSSEARFAREARLLEALDHPAIVGYRAHAVVEPGVGALVMDLVDGGDLEQIVLELEAGRPCHPAALALCEGLSGSPGDVRATPEYARRVCLLLAKVADGLARVHAEGVVHRDVKPANILVTRDLEPRLIDFGLARDWAQGGLTMTGMAMGTLSYMAPEQLRAGGHPVGDAADTYSLGLVLFRLMLGRLPHSHLEDLTDARRRSVRIGRDERLPDPVRQVLVKALQRDPWRRYRTATELAEDLRRAASGASIPVRAAAWLGAALRAVAAACLLLAGALVLLGQGDTARQVVFVANCLSEDAVVEIDGDRRVFLDQQVALQPGVYDVRLVGERVASIPVTVSVGGDAAQQGAQRVPLLTQYAARTPSGRLSGEGRAMVHFMSGHSFEPVAADAPRDLRWIDDEPVRDIGPYPENGNVKPGEHVLRARDGLGREETQRVRIGSMPTDVQLLPAVVSDVDGAYRRTWSTILAPRPDDLEVRHSASPWFGPTAESTVGGAGLMALPCALTAAGEGDAEAVVECRFPAPMRTAVVYLRTVEREGAALVVEASLGGERFVPWPRDDEGALRSRMALRAEAGADRLVVRGRLRSGSAPTRGRADAQFLRGVHFGGHWRDEPPCFAVVADPGERATLPSAPAPIGLDDVPEWSEVDRRRLALDVFGRRPGQLLPLRSGGRTTSLLIGGSDLQRRVFAARLSWPDLEVLQKVDDPALFMEQGEPNVIHKNDTRVAFAALPDLDGDGVDEIALGVGHAGRRGGLLAGAVAVVDGASMERLWSGPSQPAPAPFGDEEFGRDVSVCTASDGAVQLLATVPGYRDARGQRVGMLVALDARTGREAWRVTGPLGEGAIHSQSGTWQTKDGPWCLVQAARYSSSGDSVLRTEVFAVPVGRRASPVLVHSSNRHMLARLCRGGDRPRWITASLDDAGRLQLQRFEASPEGVRSVAAATLALPWSMGAVEDLQIISQVKSCKDIDGDGAEDFGVLLQEERGEGQLAAMVLLCSSADLMPLAKVALKLYQASVWCVVGGGDEPIELLMIEEVLPGTGIDAQLRRYSLR